MKPKTVVEKLNGLHEAYYWESPKIFKRGENNA
jgi:hypothetical protein